MNDLSWSLPTSPALREAGEPPFPQDVTDAAGPRTSPQPGARFIGCSCDRKYAEPTAVMLTSLSVNGDVPDAQIIVAAFDLEERDIDVLAAGAGSLAPRMRILKVTREMLRDVEDIKTTESYPPAVLGRLLVPYTIQGDGARLVTLDSDMIINGSLRPLFETEMGNEFFGAVQDLPRDDDLNYFNSGMTLIDVDGYRHYDIGRRCLHWMGAQPEWPRWADQDALNVIVGHLWCRLDRQWNYTHYGWRDPPEHAYETSPISHFTAHPKPWDDSTHVGRRLYDRYRDILKARLGNGP